LSAGALTRDEFDKPLGFDEVLNLQRKSFDFKADPGRAEYEMLHLKELDVFEGMRLFCGTQKPYWQTFPAGKGKVIVVGFFPAISYIATSKRLEGADHSTLDFDAAYRNWMCKVLTEGGIQPRLCTDNYRIEANWIQSPAVDIIALSNWTGHKETTTLELHNAPVYGRISSVIGKIHSKEMKNETLFLKVSFAAGDLIRLKH
jgi:hypothetical protein